MTPLKAMAQSRGRTQSPWSLHANALNLMAQRGETNAMKRAIDSGADINETDRDWFPLLMAVACNNEDVVELLLKSGAEYDKTDGQGLTSLALAVQEGHVKPMTMLLEHGADVDRCTTSGTAPLFLACGNGDVEAVQVLIQHGADVNLRKKETGATPLHAAVRKGAADVCRFLLVSGADANIPDDLGATPLLAAVEDASKAPPSPQRRRRKQRAPPQSFPEELRETLCEALLAGGADPDKTSDAHTPLTASCQRGSLLLARRLLGEGADSNRVDGQGRPPLLVAASLEEASETLCELLLVRGASVNGSDINGATALHAAVHRGHVNTVRLLLAHGADVNACTRSAEDLELAGVVQEVAGEALKFPAQFTPLRLATCASTDASQAILDDLLGHGALENLDTCDLRTPEDVARWFRAQSWHGRLATDLICERLAHGSEGIKAVDGEALFSLSSPELDVLLALEETNNSLRFVETTRRQLSTSLKPQLAAQLWHRKVRRHALLQRDRDERRTVSNTFLNEESALHDPPDNEHARSSVVQGLRAAAAAYARATARRVVAGDDVLSCAPDLKEMNEQLDKAARVCVEEASRLSDLREALRTQKYEALKVRWALLQSASERVRRSHTAPPSQPPPRTDATGTWWRAATISDLEDCPFDAESGDAARRLHLRVRAAAARPILYGSLQAVVDSINGAQHPCELGLSGIDFPLPFANESALLVGGARRCELVAVPTRPPRSADATAACVSARLEAEDPYVLACLCALLDQGHLPLRVERSRARLLERQALAFERTSVDVQVTVTYPETSGVYAAAAGEELPEEAPCPEDVVWQSRASLHDLPEAGADAPAPAPVSEVVSPSRLRDLVGRVMFAPEPAFDESLAGADLALATVRLGLASYGAVETYDEPFRRIARLDDGARRKHLFSHKLPFLDPDTWLPRTPEPVARLRHQRGAGVVEDDVDAPRAASAAASDQVALMRRAAARQRQDHGEALARSSEDLATARAALDRVTAALAARGDDVAALQAELARLQTDPASPAEPGPAATSPSPPQRRVRRGGARVAPRS